MNFAKNILSKYGWKEGDGLGREKQGIKRPIKANLKFDQAGLGADPSKEFSNNWWERAFNDAAKNVHVKKQENGEIKVNLKDEENSVEVTTKSYSVKKLADKGALYGNNFLSEDVALSSFAVTEYKALTDEELFKACGGRTAHKGARHGLKLSGKLARLEQQEKELLAKMQAKTNETILTTENAKQTTETIHENSDTADLKNISKKSKKRNRNCSENEQLSKLSKSDALNDVECTEKPAKQSAKQIELDSNNEKIHKNKAKKKKKRKTPKNEETS